MRGIKIYNFRQISRCVSEMMRYRATVTVGCQSKLVRSVSNHVVSGVR